MMLVVGSLQVQTLRSLLTVVALTVTGAWPIAGSAQALDIPEVGIRLTNLPAGAPKPEVHVHVDGNSALLHIGTATLSIERVEEPVPASSDVRDASYRQQTSFHEDLGPKAHNETTSINEHPAWTSSSARRQGDGRVLWTCVTYVIAGQHLYRLFAQAHGGEKAPADFLAAVQAMSDAAFVPVVVPSDVTPSGLLQMPAHRPNTNVDWYPASAKYRGEQGVVDLEYSIDSQGRARDVRQLYETSTAFETAAKHLLQSTTFQVRPDWDAKGYDKLRFTLEVTFALSDSPWCGDPPPPRVPAAEEQISICDSKLR